MRTVDELLTELRWQGEPIADVLTGRDEQGQLWARACRAEVTANYGEQPDTTQAHCTEVTAEEHELLIEAGATESHHGEQGADQ